MAFNPLSLLLGQQSATGLLPEEEEEYQGAIDVTGYRPRSRPIAEDPRFGDAPDRELITPRHVLNDDRVAPSKEELKEILPRSGVFGTKGTLRDILGIVGDAFLVQEGGDAVYQPQRQREKAGDAMFGFSQDPLQAIERLAIQNPELAAEVMKQYQQSQYQQGSLRSTEANRQDQASNRREDNLARLVNLTARRLQAAGDDPEKVAYALKLAQADAARNGVTLEDLGLSPELSGAQRDVFASGDMTVNQQVQVPFTERRVGVAEKNADSQRISATRPRNPPSRPRADTPLEYYRELSQKPEKDRTPEEKAFIRKYQGGKGRIGSGSAPPPPSRTINGRTFRVPN